MNTRTLTALTQVRPKGPVSAPEPRDAGPGAEAVVFDKADAAERRRKLAEQLSDLDDQLEQLRGLLKSTDSATVRTRLEGQIATTDAARERLATLLKQAEEEPRPT